MIEKRIILSNQAKEQLARLKGKTGIKNWNVLCRWALCLSLRSPNPPPDINHPADSNVEMSWETFAGEYQELYAALLVQRCLNDGLGSDPEVLARQFRLHLHRGIGYLASNFIKTGFDLIGLAVGDSPDLPEEEGLEA
ncbi:MAG TPA: DNA sulfur modification protein DndE [Symbiobacteriaceae bacterium]|jgi:DNA sulfur modification protein DndE